MPRQRVELDARHAALHAALRAGVTRADFAAGRLVRGQCAERDASKPGGVAWVTATALLPPRASAAPKTLLLVATAASSESADVGGADSMRLHGPSVGNVPVLDDSNGIRTDPVIGTSAPLRALCRPPSTPAGLVQIEVMGPVRPWEFDFAAAELARHAQFSDAELATGAVVQVSCQLKVLDGGDWYAPVWLGRAPAGLNLAPGDVVALRAGAEENSKDVEPPAQVLARAERGADRRQVDLVRCR